ncbi:MAG: MarR family transcriptional regulator [Verrucomicrobia bacterium]|jgi:BlaI family transcriptional regulator, penicillinase repressor|nr:MarR family transcriptional regulator [Verrucomicrobiota bacterium]MDA7645186.1 BlaI/MecI/CopY family transcriptional regulator [bacterium]
MSELGLTDHELAVMEELWRLGAATIRQVTVAIHTDPNTAKYATVQRQLDRLEGKGFIRRRKTTWKNEFEPILSRSDIVGQSLQRLADRLCSGSFTPIVANLATKSTLTAKQRAALQSLIDQSKED